MSSHSDIEVLVTPTFLGEHADAQSGRYAFSYTITIRNNGAHSAQLLARRWVITDGDGKVQEVEGAGVVGEQPTIAPGEQYVYTSGVVLDTPVGTMEGHYRMLGENTSEFDAPIPRFRLAVPNTLH